MKTILIAKGGGVYRTRSAQSGNAVGEQGETEGVINHLLERNDIRLVYFGRYVGDVPDGLTVIAPKLYTKSHYTSAADQAKGFSEDERELAQLEDPVAFIHTAGYSPTFSMVDNPKAATVQVAAINYTAPMLNAMEFLKLPRIVINNDPRTYPRDQEMSYGWDHARPAAILDQTDRDWSQVVGGVRYKCKSVHSRAESWAYHELEENEHVDPCVCVAHAHFTTGIRNGDPEIWKTILEGELPERFYIYGDGWPTEFGSMCQGRCDPEDAALLFRIHTCGPVVSHTPGFYTGKPYVMMSKGCVPLLHSSYDPKELFMPHDSEWRLRHSGDLKRCAELLHSHRDVYDAAVEHWHNVLQPDWSDLDRLVDGLVSGIGIPDGLGGYKRL